MGLLGCKGALLSVNVNVIIYPRNFNVGDIFTTGMNSSDPRPHILLPWEIPRPFCAHRVTDLPGAL
ncbi:protein of unknown function [Enterobacter cancerogenus]|nr:protein of unknown function [Enterobacter cancerogenus]